jgi:hypothetical protein
MCNSSRRLYYYHTYLVDNGLDGGDVQHPLYLLAVEVGQTDTPS